MKGRRVNNRFVRTIVRDRPPRAIRTIAAMRGGGVNIVGNIIDFVVLHRVGCIENLVDYKNSFVFAGGGMRANGSSASAFVDKRPLG